MPTGSRDEMFARRMVGGGPLADDGCGFSVEEAGAVLCASAGVTDATNAANSDSTTRLVDRNDEKRWRTAWEESNTRVFYRDDKNKSSEFECRPPKI